MRIAMECRRGKKPRKSKSTKAASGRRKSPELYLDQILQLPLEDIYLSAANDRLYKPVDPSDPEIIALADSMWAQGVLEPLAVSSDGYLVSGHRRYAAAGVADLKVVPCRRLPICRSDYSADEWLRLLREHNRQRDKSRAEKLREELVTINPDDAHAKLWAYRRAEATVAVKPLKIVGSKHRAEISKAKLPFLAAVKLVIESRRKYWPLSDRQIHYALLNDPPLIHASKSGSTYGNNVASYRALVDLVTRARLAGSIPFAAIADETRPVLVWDTHPEPRPFIRDELSGLFQNYWRDLMQSQPNHVEIVGEKNTVASILKPLAMEYTITLTTGRGYCSLPPRHAIAERFRKSGKDKLVLLFVSDFDPEGEDIAHSFARSMRDDFDIEAIHPVKVALTASQVQEHDLPPVMRAKESSSRHDKFVARHGHDVFELEALDPAELQRIVRDAIESVIDRDALDAEIEAERADSVFLEGVRRTVRESLIESLPDVEINEDEGDDE